MAHRGGADVGASNGDVGETPIYAEAFPALDSSSAGLPTPTAPGSWHHKVTSFKASVVTQVFSIPRVEQKYRDFDLGETSDTMRRVRAIMAKTGSQVELSRSKDHSLHVLVTGRRNVVEEAHRQLITALQTQGFLEMNIPREHYRFLLGKGGQKLRDLERRTATRIHLPRADGKSQDKELVKIVGSKEGIDSARHELQAISDEQAKVGFERLKIPKEFHPFIHLRMAELKEKYNCRINMAPLSAPSNDITLAGDKENVTSAAQEIQQLYETKKRTTSTISIQIGKPQHKYIIGPKGSTMMEILKLTGVSVEIPPADSKDTTVTLRGEREKIGSALTVVYEKASSVLLSEVKAPSWVHRYIIGRKGANIKKLAESYPKVHIDFNGEKNMIIVEGPATEVEQARDKLYEITKETVGTMASIEVPVPRQFHRHIIGKNGQGIGRLKAGASVNITVPPDSSATDSIRVDGLKADVAKAKEAIVELVKVLENERMKEVHVEHRFHSVIIGSGGGKIQQLRKTCNNVQVIFPTQGRRSDIVQVRGPKGDVDKAAILLEQMNEDLIAENYTITVPIFKKFHRNIIGRHGAAVRKLREETGCRIDIPTDGADSDIITLIGRKENVDKAKKRILAIQDEQGNITTAEIQIPQKFHNSMIGRHGKLLNNIQEECGGVHIKFPGSKQTSDTVVIRGLIPDVEKAKRQLLELADERALNSATEEVRAKKEYHKFLIGRGGANVKQIRDTTGTRIIFPSERDDDPEVIVIIGRQESVLEAKVKLEQLIKDLENTVEESLNVPVKHHRHFVQRRGHVLRGLTEELGGVQLTFPRSGSDSEKVTIKGGKDCVAEAKRRIQEIVQDLESQVTEECTIPAKYHRAVLGQRGTHVQSIVTDFDVSIKFPDRPAGKAETVDETVAARRDIIEVTGRKDSVEKACEALLSLVPVSEEVPVRHEYHRFIIGRKGEGIQRMMADYNVEIRVPPHDKQLDYLTVTGQKDDVISCTQALQQQLAHLDEEREDRRLRSFKLRVDIDPKYHSKLIGRGGDQVMRLRRQFDVQFHFPKKDDEDTSIVIQGYETSCDAAKNSILAIVRDLEEQVSREVEIDTRCHSRIIGQKGRSVRHLMDKFSVDIRFSQDKKSPMVTVTGLPDKVEDCCEHMLLLVEEYMQDVLEREDENALMRQYTSAPSRGGYDHDRSDPQEFVLRNAPWSSSTLGDEEQFPSFGGPSDRSRQVQWGPRRR